MTVTYSLLTVPSTPVRIDVPQIDQTDITKTGDSSITNKKGETIVTVEYSLAGASLLEAAKIKTTVTLVPTSARYPNGYDAGPTSQINVKLTAPYRRVDSVSGAENVSEVSATIAVVMPQTIVDPSVVLDLIYACASLFVSEIDGTSHEPMTDNVSKLMLAGQPWQ